MEIKELLDKISKNFRSIVEIKSQDKFFVSIVDLNKKYTINILKPDKLLTEEIDLTKDLLIEIKLDAAKEMVTGKLNTEDSLFQGNVTLNGNVKVLDNIVKKAVGLQKHLKANKKDNRNVRALELIEAKVHRLSVYYKKIGRISQKWK